MSVIDKYVQCGRFSGKPDRQLASQSRLAPSFPPTHHFSKIRLAWLSTDPLPADPSSRILPEKSEGVQRRPLPPAEEGFSCPTGCPLVQIGPVAVKPAARAGHRWDGGQVALCAGGWLGPPPAQSSPSLPAWVLGLAAAHPGSARSGGKTW